MVFLVLTVIFLWMASAGKPKLFIAAGASACGVVLCILVPILTISFLCAVKIILYGIVSLVVVCVIIVGLWLWRKLHTKDKAAEGFIASVDHVLAKLKPEDAEQAVKELKKMQSDTTRKVYKEVKG